MLAGIIFLTIGIAALSFFAYYMGYYVGAKNAGRIIFREMPTDQFEAISKALLKKMGEETNGKS
jgi:hypothetical protein